MPILSLDDNGSVLHRRAASMSTESDQSAIDEKGWINDPAAWDYCCSLLTVLYACFAIVFAIVLELSQKLVADGWVIETVFYTYMYGMAIIFLVYCCIFQVNPSRFMNLFRIPSTNRWSPNTFQHIGHSSSSLYLRLGTLFFGTSAIVLFCLELFVCFSNHRCFRYKLINWSFACIFTFAQMYFVFCNSKIVITESKNLVKLGTMHLLAVNVWTWLRFVIAKQEGKSAYVEQSSEHLEELFAEKNETILSNENSSVAPLSTILSFNYFGDFASLLTTCIVEFSVISAAMMFVLWRSIDDEPSISSALISSKQKHKVRIDCRMRRLHYHKHPHSNAEFLDEILLMIGLIGEMIHSSTGLICWVITQSEWGKHKMENYMLLVFVVREVQVIVQAVFILVSGRFVTFLLIANVSLFFFHTLEGMKSVFGGALKNRRTKPYTTLICAVAPLVVFYRFHSSVCLAEIWKNCYNTKGRVRQNVESPLPQ